MHYAFNTAVPPVPAKGSLSAVSSYRFGLGVRTLIAPPLAALAIGMWVPLLFVIGTGLFSGTSENIVVALQQPLFISAMIRTFTMAAIVTAICLPLGLLFAISLAISSKGVRILLALAIGTTFVISLMVRSYGWIILLQPRGILANTLNSLGLLDGPLSALQTPVAMYLGMVHVMLPYSIVLTYSALNGVGANQLRAARSMGASGGLTFRLVILPQIAGGILAGSILVFMLSLGFYITPALLGGPTQMTIATVIGREMGQKFDFQSAAVMSTALLVIVTGLYILAEKTFRLSERWSQQ